jgi:hypothetical protein
VPSRKQRRRRAKERRHDYEYVYVDDEGAEVEAPAAVEPKRPRSREAKDRNGKRVSRDSKRPLREQNPPSWTRSARRAALFFPLFFIVFSLVNKHQSIGLRILYSAFYSVLFIPLTYLMDRTAYRAYLRRSGRDAGGKR